MNKILSVIIPSFNMEKYLNQCIDSLLVPSLEDIEILIINDGSTDMTSTIGHGFQDQYSSSIRIIDKQNGHYGSCINRGIKEAKGKYIKILDADDSFIKENFEDFINLLKSTDSDLIISDYCLVNEDGNIESERHFQSLQNKKNSTFSNALPILKDINMAMHAITYKTSILKDFNYQQTEGVAYTDQEWIFSPMHKVDSIAQYNKVLYRYLVGREGQSVDKNVISKSKRLQIKLIDKRLDDYKIYFSDADNAKKEYAIQRLKYCMINTYKAIILGNVDKEIEDSLLNLESKLNNIVPELYVDLGKEKLKKNISFNYIKYWRRKKLAKKPTPILNMIKLLHH